MTDSPPIFLSDDQTKLLLDVAAASLQHGLIQRQALQVDPQDYAEALQTPRAAFVTLAVDDQLHGCVGTLESTQPLVINVAKYAYAAGFTDTRFPELTAYELGRVQIHISILSGLEVMGFAGEDELLEQLRPGIDGLLLEDASYRGTLLPSVWETVHDKREFLQLLKRKAGLPPGYWSATLQIKRYTATCIP